MVRTRVLSTARITAPQRPTYCDIIQHHSPVVVDDSVDPMRHGQHGAVGELVPDGGLEEAVRLVVHGRRRLVQHQQPRPPQQGPSQAHQLTLTHAT